MEAQAKTQCTTPSSENMEYLPSPYNPSTRSSSYESFHHMEKSPADTDQCIPQVFDLPKEINKSSLPKLLFAEWLALDHVNGGSFENSGHLMASRDGFNNQNSNFVQDNSFVHGYNFSNEGAFGGEFHNGFNNGLVDEMLSSRFKFEDHHQFSGLGFVDSISGDHDICSDLNMNMNMSNDVMYI